jgi:integrase
MSDFVFDLLQARRALGRENEYVFPGTSSSGHLEEPKKALHDVGRACGVKVSVHDLRRTFITVAARCRIPPAELKAIVNHSVGTDVTAGYQRLEAGDLLASMQAVTDRLKALCGV